MCKSTKGQAGIIFKVIKVKVKNQEALMQKKKKTEGIGKLENCLTKSQINGVQVARHR